MREYEDTEVIVVDADYIREQAQQAIATFLAPLLGVYGAATGKRVRLQKRKRDKAA